MAEDEGFEPPRAWSAPSFQNWCHYPESFDLTFLNWYRGWGSNPQTADFKSARFSNLRTSTWYGRWDSNPQAPDSKSGGYSNSPTSAQLLVGTAGFEPATSDL